MEHAKKRYQKILCLLLSSLLVTGVLLEVGCIRAAGATKRTLSLEQVYTLALANSEEYSKLNNKKNMQQAAYQAAVKSIQMKKASSSTIRWSPLVSFKFPEAGKMSEEFEYTYKPYIIQAQISATEHELNDVKYSIREEISVLYAKLYEGQQVIDFSEKKLEAYKTTQKRKQAQTFTGEATKAEVEKLQQSISALTAKIASDSNTFLANKLKLGDLLQLDISTDYTFQNPFVQVDLSRQDLDGLIDRTLEYNHELFEKKLDVTAKMIAMDTNYSLMKGHYGDKVSPLELYINQAKAGEKINSAALKTAYQNVTSSVEAPWEGSFKILFISIPKEWLKGTTSGVRYLENGPDAMHNAILEYQEVLQEQRSMEKELRQQVTDAYQTLVAVKNTYLAAAQNTERAEKELEKGSQLSIQGAMTAAEMEMAEEEYSSSQLDEMKALADYSQVLYSFDRLTCGGVTEWMETARNTSATGGSTSLITANMAEGAYYYIRNIVEDSSFEFGLSIPENYQIDVTTYELWVDGIQVGARTEVGKTIVHLTLAAANTQKVFVRLYNGEEFIDDCVIDPSVYSGALEVVEGYTASRKVSDIIGSFTYTTNGAAGITTIRLKLNADELAKFYVVKNAAGTDLLSGRKTAVTDGFSYLSLTAGSIDELQIEFYDKLGNPMYTAHLNSVKLTIKKDQAGS